MASRKTYICFVCQKSGHEVQVYLDGKDAEGRTKYLNEDGTKHIHKTKLQQQPQQQQHEQDNNPLAPVSDESVERGIDAFNLMTSLN
jgi:hypothetical protein